MYINDIQTLSREDGEKIVDFVCAKIITSPKDFDLHQLEGSKAVFTLMMDFPKSYEVLKIEYCNPSCVSFQSDCGNFKFLYASRNVDKIIDFLQNYVAPKSIEKEKKWFRDNCIIKLL